MLQIGEYSFNGPHSPFRLVFKSSYTEFVKRYCSLNFAIARDLLWFIVILRHQERTAFICEYKNTLLLSSKKLPSKFSRRRCLASLTKGMNDRPPDFDDSLIAIEIQCFGPSYICF